MDPTSIGLFQLAERRLAWVEQRQSILAQNVANAATPGYEARDVAPFRSHLAQAQAGLAVTQPTHIAFTESPLGAGVQARPTERTVDGNAVSMEEQLTRVADMASAQELTTGLYRKYMGMFRTALGRTG